MSLSPVIEAPHCVLRRLCTHLPYFASARVRTQALYFSVVTMATVGYGDLYPTPDARAFTVSGCSGKY